MHSWLHTPGRSHSSISVQVRPSSMSLKPAEHRQCCTARPIFHHIYSATSSLFSIKHLNCDHPVHTVVKRPCPHRSLRRAVAALGAAAVGFSAARLAAAALVRAICTVGNAVAHQGWIKTLLRATLELVGEAGHRSTWYPHADHFQNFKSQILWWKYNKMELLHEFVHWKRIKSLDYDETSFHLISSIPPIDFHPQLHTRPVKCESYPHSVSSLPSSQSFTPSHFQVVEMHLVLDLQGHWKSPQFSGITGQSWRETSYFYSRLNWSVMLQRWKNNQVHLLSRSQW